MRDLLILCLLWLAVGVVAYLCARLTRPDRNYYPMQRVIWGALSFVGMGAGLSDGAALLFGGEGSTTIAKTVFAGALVAATTYAARFMRKRNTTPRYIALDIAGQELPVDEEHLRRQSENVTSVVHHGAAPEAWVTGLEEACAEWRRKQRWKTEGLPGQLRQRRAAKAAQQREEGRP